MRLLLQVSAVLSAIVLSFSTAPVGATTYSFDSFAPLNFALPGDPGTSANSSPTKWGQEPNSASFVPSFGTPDRETWTGTPGSATWSVMGTGLEDDFFGIDDPHIGQTKDFTALLGTGVAGDRVELAMIDDALNLWDAASGFTNLGNAVQNGGVDGGGNFGTTPAANTQVGDIRIGAISFGGSLGLLAHAFQPGVERLFTDVKGNPIPGGSIYGDIHLDSDEVWINPADASGTTSGIDLFTVLLHELGHALGLEHSTNSQSVMFGTYSGAQRELNLDDIAAIQYLYGPPKPATVPEPGTLTLLGLGLAGLVAGIRRRRKAAREE